MSRKRGLNKPTMQPAGDKPSGAQRKAARAKVGPVGVKHEGGRGKVR
jgi:hypothetical protein